MGDSEPPPPEPGSTSRDGDRQYTFVLQHRQDGVHSQAMRDYWRRRHRRTEEQRATSRTLRPLLPNYGTPAVDVGLPLAMPANREQPRLSPHQNLPLQLSSSEARSTRGSPNAEHSAPQTNSPAIAFGSQTDNIQPQGIPAQMLTGMNYALACSRLDPFDVFPIVLTAQHHKLLHHWLSTHATMMFDQLPIETFNPMRDVWLPLDLSNAASFNIIMAHSAAHLARMQGMRISNEALKYKNEAVHTISLWMKSESRLLSDDVCAAVLRLLTYERYWGSESEWRVHRDGLQHLIEARGGIASLHHNWRLELVTFLVLLMAKPSWFDISNEISQLSPETFAPASSNMLNLQQVRGLWLISFVQDMRTLMTSSSQLRLHGLAAYTAVHAAVKLLQNDLQYVEPSLPVDAPCTTQELATLDCLFFMSMLLQRSLASHDDSSPTTLSNLSYLDAVLSERRDEWQDCVENLHKLLFNEYSSSPESAQTTNYVFHMTNILKLLSSEARRGVKRCLIFILCPPEETEQNLPLDDAWTPDSLLSSLHGI